jgi:hypothetical protein
MLSGIPVSAAATGSVSLQHDSFHVCQDTHPPRHILGVHVSTAAAHLLQVWNTVDEALVGEPGYLIQVVTKPREALAKVLVAHRCGHLDSASVHCSPPHSRGPILA